MARHARTKLEFRNEKKMEYVGTSPIDDKIRKMTNMVWYHHNTNKELSYMHASVDL